MKRKSATRLTTVVALGIAGLLTVGACSSDDSSSASKDTTTTTASKSASPMSSAPASAQTIADIAASNPDFSTLVSAVQAAGLGSTLSGPGPYTVFAPTNEAFAKVPAATLQELLKPENSQKLADILKYHVVAGKVMAADVKPGMVTTANSADFTVSAEGGNVYITDGQGNKAMVVKTDIPASNGVIHVIDTVLLPPSQ